MQGWNVIFLSSYELIMSLIFAVVSVVLAMHAINKFVISLPVRDFIRLKHKPGCLISATLIFSVVYLARNSIEQSTLALQALVNANGGIGMKPLLIALAYFVVFYFISFMISFFALFAASQAYRILMKPINFDHEIEKNENMGLSIFLSMNLISVVLFIDQPIAHMLGSLVFYEHIQRL